MSKYTPSPFFSKISAAPVIERPSADSSGVLIQLATANINGIEKNMIDTIYMIVQRTEEVPNPDPNSDVPYVQQKKKYKVHNKKTVRYFEQSYNKYANFGMMHFFTPINNSAQEFTVDVGRFGDMIYNTYLSFVVPDFDIRSVSEYSDDESARWAWCTKLGNAVIRNAEVMIGSQKIDENDTNVLNFSRELSVTDGRQRMYHKIIGNVPELCEMASSHPQRQLFVPMNFFFNKSTQCVLSILQIQYFKVEINFAIRQPKELICCSKSLEHFDWNQRLQFKQFSLVTKQVYLQDEERYLLTEGNAEKELLFEKYQKNQISPNQSNVVLINHSVKELVWLAQLNKYTKGSSFLYYAPVFDRSIDVQRLTKNATIRFVLKTAMYAKAYKYKPYQKGGDMLAISDTSSVVDESKLTSKTVVYPRISKSSQMEFAVLKTQCSSKRPKSVVHFQTLTKLLSSAREYSSERGIRDLNQNYITVEQQQEPVSEYKDNFINLDHAYSRIKPVQTDQYRFNEQSIAIYGDTLRIEEVSIPVEQLINYKTTPEINIRINDKIQQFYYDESQETILVDSGDKHACDYYVCERGDIDVFAFFTQSGINSVSFQCSAKVDTVNTLTYNSGTEQILYYTTPISNTNVTLDSFNEQAQIQQSQFAFNSDPLKPNFNWAHSNYDVCVRQFDNYGMNLDKTGNPYAVSSILCNGTSRFSNLGDQYFNSLQPFECHSNSPADGINVYSFSIKPEDTRPNGSMNFSRIETIQFNSQMNDRIRDGSEGTVEASLYSLSFNVLAIHGGSAYVKFSS